MKKSVLLPKSKADFFVFSLTFTNFIAEYKTLKSLDTMSTNISRRNFLRLSALGTSALVLPSAANALEAPLFAPAKDKKGSANDKINLGSEISYLLGWPESLFGFSARCYGKT